MNFTAEMLAQLAQEFELSDPINWGMLLIDEQEAYLSIAENVMEILENSEEPELVCATAMVKLLVENYVLNLQLAGFGTY